MRQTNKHTRRREGREGRERRGEKEDRIGDRIGNEPQEKEGRQKRKGEQKHEAESRKRREEKEGGEKLIESVYLNV